MHQGSSATKVELHGYSKKVERASYIDVLKILAALAVVLLHTNSAFWEGPATPTWAPAALIQTLLLWAAPMFFMISGATLFDYRKKMTTSTYAAKRVRKTVIPYCAWNAIAILFFTIGPFEVISPALSVRELFKAYILPGVSPYTLSVYWYFPALYAVYIAIPFLSSMEYKYLRVLACILVIFQSAIPTFAAISGIQFINSDFAGSLNIGYALLAVLGFVLSKEEIPREWRIALYVLGALSWGAEFFGTLAVSNATDGVVPTYVSYVGLFCLIQTAAVFVFTKNACSRLESVLHGNALRNWQEKSARLASLTFGVYLIHFYFTSCLPKAFPIDCYSLSWKLLGGVAIFAGCSVITAALGKIPRVNKVLLGK